MKKKKPAPEGTFVGYPIDPARTRGPEIARKAVKTYRPKRLSRILEEIEKL